MALIVYPNPNQGKFYVEVNNGKSGPKLIELHRASGELIYSGEIGDKGCALIDLKKNPTELLTLSVRINETEMRREVMIECPDDTDEKSTLNYISVKAPSLN